MPHKQHKPEAFLYGNEFVTTAGMSKVQRGRGYCWSVWGITSSWLLLEWQMYNEFVTTVGVSMVNVNGTMSSWLLLEFQRHEFVTTVGMSKVQSSLRLLLTKVKRHLNKTKSSGGLPCRNVQVKNIFLKKKKTRRYGKGVDAIRVHAVPHEAAW